MDEEDRRAVDREVARIVEHAHEEVPVRVVVRVAVALGDQHLLAGRLPAAAQIPVHPHQAERHVRAAVLEHVVERAPPRAVTLEPVVLVAERVDAVRRGDAGLSGAGLRQTQVVEAEIARQARLIVAGEQPLGAHNAEPFGEARAVPRVGLRNREECRQVQRDRGGTL